MQTWTSGSGNRAGQSALRPQFVQRSGQMPNVGIGVHRCRRDSQPFGFHRHRRIVDRLHIYPVIVHQYVGYPFAFGRVTDHDRDDVAGIGHMRNAMRIQRLANFCDGFLMSPPLKLAGLEVANGGCRSAASAGGSAVVKMKPEAKLRTKSHKAREPVM
jgi:hypothetical protein